MNLPILSNPGDLAVAPPCNSGLHSVLVPTNSPSGGYWACKPSSTPVKDIVFNSSFLIATLWYYLATLAFELPVLYVLGFRSKRAIITATLANFFTVFGFHFVSSYCSQSGKCNLSQGLNSGFIVAEALITVAEAIIYFAVLNKEMTAHRIVLASLMANLSSAIIGGVIVNGLFGGFH
jgi:hypothetical protein